MASGRDGHPTPRPPPLGIRQQGPIVSRRSGEAGCELPQRASFLSDKRVGFSIAGQTPVWHDRNMLVGYARVSTLDLVLQSGH